MSLPSLTLALLAWVLIIGCATKNTAYPRLDGARKVRYQRGWNTEEGAFVSSTIAGHRESGRRGLVGS